MSKRGKWTLPDGSVVTAGADLDELYDALQEVEGERDDWEAVAMEIDDEIGRREEGAA